ncbi:MAG TPA: GFA family protein [Caldimonas sp.]|nr:GFA family protein [Caldimonas sp.]
MSFRLAGGCLCSTVRFRASQRPARTLACHCTFCQRLTGSAFYVESIFPTGAVAFEGGEIKTYQHVSDTSGRTVTVEFCARCGTTLGLTFERWPQIRAISRSCFDEPSEVAIDAHIWTRSAQTGVALPSGVDCYAESPYMPNGEAEVPIRHRGPFMVGAAGDA